MHVVATAGHVDHGKSTLVLTLTGTDPDRWAEEKARGLTIDLGFAHAELPSGAPVSLMYCSPFLETVPMSFKSGFPVPGDALKSALVDK